MNEIRETILPSSPTATSPHNALRPRVNSQPVLPNTSALERTQSDEYTGPVTRSHGSPTAAPRAPSVSVPAPPRPRSSEVAAPRVPVAVSHELRTLKLERPIVAFDLETTGLNRNHDAIIEWGAVKEWPTGKREEHLFRIKPRVPVQPTAERIHGISNAALAGCDTFDKVAPKIADIVRGSDLLGHNARAFDLPFLTIEMARVGQEDCLEGARVVDTLKTFRKAVPRGQGTDNHRLGTAYKFYLGRPLEGAHGALADARASLEVLHAQLERHPELPDTVAELEAIEDKR